MNDALVKAIDPKLTRIALKKIVNHKSAVLEPQLPFAQLIEKIHREDITRAHIDRNKTNKNSTISSTIKNISMEVDNLTIDYISINS